MVYVSIRYEWKFLYIMFFKVLFIVIFCKWFYCLVYRFYCIMNNNESIIELVLISFCGVVILVIFMFIVYWYKLESYIWWFVFFIDRD